MYDHSTIYIPTAQREWTEDISRDWIGWGWLVAVDVFRKDPGRPPEEEVKQPSSNPRIGTTIVHARSPRPRVVAALDLAVAHLRHSVAERRALASYDVRFIFPPSPPYKLVIRCQCKMLIPRDVT